MKESDVVLRTVTKLIAFILLTFGFYVSFVGHNNPGGGLINGLIFSPAFTLIFLALSVEEVLESLPIDFRVLMIIGTLVSSITAIIPMSFREPSLPQCETVWILPILEQIHVSIITLFELGVLFSVVGVIVTAILSFNEGRL